MITTKLYVTTFALLVSSALLLPRDLQAHCDSIDGPVITEAKAALAAKDVTSVLKWVNKESEGEIKSAFEQTLAVRGLGKPAEKLADRFFFETLVRVHRMGEGAPFTGLKDSGTEVSPAIVAAESALKTGEIGSVMKLIHAEAAAGAQQRLAEVRKKQMHAHESVAAGREYVAAYVDYIHYLEGLHQAAEGSGSAHHQHPEENPAAPTLGDHNHEH